MKRFLSGFIIGGLVVAGVVWYCANERQNPTAQDAKQRVESMAKDAKEAVHDKMQSMDIHLDDIKDELARTGKVIRRKAQSAGAAIADAAADAKITTTIKAKMVADPDLSALSISVNTTDGRVTLSGTTSSAENIRKAMVLALDTDGVQEVVSTLQVK